MVRKILLVAIVVSLTACAGMDGPRGSSSGASSNAQQTEPVRF